MNALQLQRLDASLRRQPVLSIYLTLDTGNPLDRRAWGLELVRGIKRVRESLANAAHGEREAFERSAGHAEAALRGASPDAGGATWIAFATPEEIADARFSDARVPNVIAWGEGIRIAPYLLAVEAPLPVVVLLGDAAHVDLWEYRDGVARRVERIHAHHGSDAPVHMSAGPRQGFHSGTRGAVAHDEVQRRRREGTRRMLELAAARAVELAGPDGWVFTGGIPHIRSRLARLLTQQTRGRSQAVKGLDVHSSAPAIAAAARENVERVRSALDATSVRNLIERAAPTGLGALGMRETSDMLLRSRVQELVLTASFVALHPEEAEAAVRSAQAQHARVAIVEGDAATRLDAVQGIAARLRYRLDGHEARSRSA